MHSFLLDRQQRVKIGYHFSDWTTQTGGMTQGASFGPYVFLILIGDLNTIMATLKFVDNVTLTELIDETNISRKQVAADQITDWSHRNFMNFNTKKTEEMLFSRITENPPPQVTFNIGAVDRVTPFKLLSITISDNLSWENHANAVCAKAGGPVWQSDITTD